MGKYPAMVDVRSCARCGQDHDKIVFQPFKESRHSEHIAWALCPNYGEPILLRKVEDDMPADMKSLAIEYDAALAAGDRPRLIAVFRRIMELVGSLDSEKITQWTAFIKKMLELLPSPPAQSNSLGVVTLSADEATAAGITDNVTTIVELIRLIIEWYRRSRS